jgi:PAS domain S-box-containing protein
MTAQIEYSSSFPLAAFLRSLSKKLSLTVLLIGAVVILGWLFNISLLKTALPWLPALKINAALCFVLAGAALRGWHQLSAIHDSNLKRSVQWLIVSSTLLMISIATLTLLEYGFNTDLGIDQLLMPQPEPIGGLAVPGRMAFKAALAFLLSGLALLGMNSRCFSVVIIQGMAICTWLISFVSLLGHIYGGIYFYTAGSYTGMAIHAAIAFQLLSIGILCALPDRGFMLLLTSNGAGSLMMQRLLPVVITFALLIGSLSLLGYRMHLYEQEVEATLSSTLQILVFVVLFSWTARSMNRIDLKRRQMEDDLQQANISLEQIVDELQETNDRLQQELFQRERVEQELQESVSSLRSLHEVIAAGHQSFEQRIQDLLAMGCQLFGLEFGILARVQHGLYQVMVARSPNEALKPGDTFDVKQTLCCEVLDTHEPLIIEHAGVSRWRHHPAYAAFQMECYIGTRVLVGGGEVYSTISFSSKTPGIGKFKPAHKELLKLMAQWIGSEIDRQQAETELRQMSTALENAVSGISRLDPQGKYAAVNHAYARAARYQPEEMLGMNWQTTVHPDDIDKMMLAYQQMRQDGKVEVEAKGLRKDGSIFYKQLVMIAIYDEQQQFIGHHCFMKDISDRKQIEAQLRRSEAALIEAQRVAHVGNWALDTITQQITWSEELFRMFGFDPANPEPGYAEHLNYIHPDDRELLQSYIQQASENGAPYEIDLRFFRTDGTIGYMEAKGRAFRDESGQITRLFGTALDISDRKASEEALYQSEATLRSFFNSGSMMMGIVELYDDDIRHISDNAATANFFGMSQAAMQNQLASAMGVLRHHIEFWLGHYREAQRTQAPVQFEYAHQTPEGEKWLSVTVCAIATSPDQRPRCSYIVEDISDRKRTEEALTQELLRSKALFKASFDGIVVIDRQGNVIEASESFAKMLGYSLEEVKTLHVADWDAQWTREEIIQIIQDSKLIDAPFETLHRRKDSSVYEVEISVNDVKLDDEAIQICICRDISERKRIENDRKQAEVALQKSEERLQLALEASGDGLWDWNIATQAIYLSPHYLEMLDYEANELPGNCETWDKLIHPDDKSWVLETLNAHLQDSSVQYAFDYRLQTKSGEWKWIANYGKVVTYDEHGHPLRMIGTHKDITDRKQFELELQRAKEAAEVANQAKSIFLANMSHELRTPLNVILGFTQVMHHDSTLSLEQQEHIQIIHRSGEHLLSLINNILDLSKIEAGRATVDRSNFDVIALLQSLWEMLRLRAENKGLQFNLEIAIDVPQYINTDPNKLRQVLINLLGNAIKFTKTGSITLRVRTGIGEIPNGSPLPAPSSLIFEIEDTGVGIATSELESIFDAFIQTQSGKNSTDGTGLGLTISRRFVQLMGGELTVNSTLGQGSTFGCHIPVQVVNAAEVSPLPIQRRIIGLAPGQPLYRILVVDDQAENRQVLVKFLTRLQLEVRQARDGEEAIALVSQWQPHLVWMDIRMPKTDGYEATQMIRATPEGKSIAIIALTAQASRSDRTLALSAGCNDYLSKPFKEDELFTKMAEHLGLEYVYEEQNQINTISTNSTPHVTTTTSDLQVMPPDWLAALQQAAQHCDDEEVSHLIAQIPEAYTSLATGLKRLAHDFQFKQIVQLIQAHSNSRSE